MVWCRFRNDDPPTEVTNGGDGSMDPFGEQRAVPRCGRVLLAVAANEIIIGGLQSSLVVDGCVAVGMVVRWWCDGVDGGSGGLYSTPWRPSATRVREQRGALSAEERAREAEDKRMRGG